MELKHPLIHESVDFSPVTSYIETSREDEDTLILNRLTEGPHGRLRSNGYRVFEKDSLT